MTTFMFFLCWIFLPLLTLLTTKFSSPAWTLFLAFSLLHSNGFSHTCQTDISPLQSITRLRHQHSSCTVCLRAQYWAHSLRPVHYASLRYHSQPLCKPSALRRWHTAPEIRSSQWSDQPHQRTQSMHRQHKNMDDGKSAQAERRQNRSSSLSLFVFLETFYRSPPWLDYSWLSQHPLLWFCQEPWSHSWLKTVHEEARHKNLPNCLFWA